VYYDIPILESALAKQLKALSITVLTSWSRSSHGRDTGQAPAVLMAERISFQD